MNDQPIAPLPKDILNASVLQEALNQRELSALKEHEKTIREGLAGFLEVGKALIAIREGKLYRAHYRTFEEYCEKRWSISGSRGKQLAGAAEVVQNLATIVAENRLPQNEAQVRPLTPLPADQQKQAWEKAEKMAGRNGITAKLVEKAVKEIKQGDKPKVQAAPAPTPATGGTKAAAGNGAEVEAVTKAKIDDALPLIKTLKGQIPATATDAMKTLDSLLALITGLAKQQ